MQEVNFLMKCPYCGSTETKVVDKRESENLEVTRRRRECLKCTKRFTTYERVESVTLTIVKKDGSRAPFDRRKILLGLMRACEKRPVSTEKIEDVVDDIESSLRRLDTTEIPSSKIGELVMSKLKKLDDIAYVRFASVYRQFKDMDEFVKEIKDYLKKK